MKNLLFAALVGASSCAAFQLPFDLASTLSTIRSKLPTFIAGLDTSSDLLALHKELISIESVTGNEKAVAEFLEEYLTERNFTVELIPVSPGRHNVLAYPKNGNRKSRVLVTSHIDTVPPFIPYETSGQRIYGRGSCDAKASVAAQIIAVEELLKEEAVQPEDVSMLYVVGEETTGDGMRHMNTQGLGWEAVIFGEPTEGKLAVGHKGLALLEVVAHGKAAHSGYPHLGVSANSLLIQALYRLDNLKLPHSDLLGDSTLNIGRIDGGVAANVIPAQARAKLAIRIAGEGVKAVKKLVEDAVADIKGVEIKWELPQYDPQVTDSNIRGFETISLSYGTDIPNLNGKHKRYLYGPGSILVAHGDNENIKASELQAAVPGYKKLILAALNPDAERKEDVITKDEDEHKTSVRAKPQMGKQKNAIADKTTEQHAASQVTGDKAETVPKEAVDNAVEPETEKVVGL